MSKLLNDKDFFMCTGGLAPAQMQTIQRVSKKKDGTLYLLKTDTATSSIIDFSCKKMMILMAIIAVVVCALVIATGGMALIAAAAIGGAIGAVAGALICGQKGAAARTWIGYKNDLKILGTETLTDSAFMKCMLFQEEIRIAPHIKNWWQAAAVGLTNFAGEMFKCVMIGAAAAGVVVLATEGIGAFFVNAASNYLMTWTTGWGLGLRGAMGVMDGVNQKYVNGTSTEDALSSGLGNAAFGMEKGTANSAYNVSTGQGTAEDYVGLLAWGAPVPKGNGEAKGPGPEADHMGSSPWEGKPQRGSTGFKESPRMSRSEVQAYKKAMNEQGINVEVDKAGRLPENTRAAFDNQTGTVYLRKGATQYEAFHEQQHAQQWKEMGKDAYNKQSRVQKEQHVYDQVMKNKDKFSQAELDHARDYMNDVRKAAGMEPMPLDKMETKGQDGDLFEDTSASIVSKTPRMAAEPPFKPGEGINAAEFERQIKGQEDGLSKLTVDEFLNNRDKYLSDGRSTEGSKAQEAYRKEARRQKIEELREEGMPRKEAEAKADEYMKDKAALHDPDQVAGGNGDNITGLGSSNVNSSIGSQWKARIEKIDADVRKAAENMTEAEKKTTFLNIHLYP
jgi:Metallopeptidase toxin 4/Novel toxin 15